MVASPEPSLNTTLRPSISAMTRTSPPRCSKRRRLMSPVVMIWPPPIDVTRPIDTKTRRFPGISTMRPTTRGGSFLRYTTRTSRTLPTRSPAGSKTAHPASRATKTLVALTTTNLAPGTGKNARSPALRGRPWENDRVSNPGPFGGRTARQFPTLPKGETVASFETYQEAQAAVDKLAKAAFPVKELAIVGTDLTSVERITGVLTWGRAAGAGALSG